MSPLTTDSLIRILLVLSLYYAILQPNWATEMIDSDAVFLNAEVDQDIFIEIPEGLCKYSQKKKGLEL
jgi:hypothetical protein